MQIIDDGVTAHEADTTTAHGINTKLPLTGGTMTGDLLFDGVRLIRNILSTASIGIAGGPASNEGANINLFGQSHATSPNRILMRANAAVSMDISSTGIITLRNGTSHGEVTGSPEGAITAIVGSTRYRTDGGAATTLYVKESGTGNTGWVAK